MADSDGILDEEFQGDLLATIAQRIGARLLDWFLLMAIWIVLGGLTSQQIDDSTRDIPLWAVAVWIGLVVVYETAFVAARGQTLGKMAMGIELVSARDGTTPGLGPALIRVMPVALLMSVLGTFFPVVLVLLYFTAAFMADRRGLLDRLAGTAVIRARTGRGLMAQVGLTS